MATAFSEKHPIRAVLLAKRFKKGEKTFYIPGIKVSQSNTCLGYMVFIPFRESKAVDPNSESSGEEPVIQLVDGKEATVSVEIHPGMNGHEFDHFWRSYALNNQPEDPTHLNVKKKGIVAKGIADAPEADVAGWIASFTEWTQRLVTAAKETMAENQAP